MTMSPEANNVLLNERVHEMTTRDSTVRGHNVCILTRYLCGVTEESSGAANARENIEVRFTLFQEVESLVGLCALERNNKLNPCAGEVYGERAMLDRYRSF